MHTKSLYRYRVLIICLLVCTCAASCATWGLSKNEKKKLAGKTVVIIGASSGIGKGTALELGKCHANVVIAARRTDLLENVAAEITASGGTALVVTMDVSKQEDVDRLAEETLKKFGKVDVWINNAGVASFGLFGDVPLAEHARVIDVNLKGTLYGSYAAMKIFSAQGYGTLINTGSGESEIPIAYQTSYSASKAGVRSIGEALHQELKILKNKRIRVVTILPWAINTPIWEHSGNHTGHQLRMVTMDRPGKVVNALMYATLHHRRELNPGWKAKFSYKLHHVFPHFTEWLAAKMFHGVIKRAPHAKETAGILFDAKNAKGDVKGNIRKQAKTERKARRTKQKSRNY